MLDRIPRPVFVMALLAILALGVALGTNAFVARKLSVSPERLAAARAGTPAARPATADPGGGSDPGATTVATASKSKTPQRVEFWLTPIVNRNLFDSENALLGKKEAPKEEGGEEGEATESDIAASSEAIIRRYLLEAAEQPLDLPEASAQHGRLRSLVETLRQPKKVEIIDPERLAQLQEGAALAAQLLDNRLRGQRLLEADTLDEDTRAALERLLADEEATLAELREQAIAAMTEVTAQTERLQQDSGDEREARRLALGEVRDAALTIVSQLARTL